VRLRDELRANFGRTQSESPFEMGDNDAQNKAPDHEQQQQQHPQPHKANFFAEGVTSEEKSLIERRVFEQQRAFADYEARARRNMVSRLRQIHRHATVEETELALEECNRDEDECAVRLGQMDFLYAVRRQIADRYAVKSGKREREAVVVRFDEKAGMTLAEIAQRREARRARAVATVKGQRRTGTGKRKLLDELVAAGTADTAGWSEARLAAWKQRDVNPNAYYYRFNAPGEAQRTGNWTPEEDALFFERYRELGCDGKWGIFSMAIPGRVGYQCSNYYRTLLKEGRITDPKYVVDSDGRTHYLFQKDIKQGVSGDLIKIKKQIRKAVNHGDLETAEKIRQELSANGPDGEAKAAAAVAAVAAAIAPGTPRGGGAGRPADPQRAAERAAERAAKDAARAAKRLAREKARDEKLASKAQKKRGRPASAAAAAKPKRKRRRGDRDVIYADSDDDDDDDLAAETVERGETWRAVVEDSGDDEGGSAAAAAAAAEEDEEEGGAAGGSENPLPGFVDPITLDEVERPAISPFGHVMGYDVWIRCLKESNNICPFTKKPLQKRNLVKLTHDNIEEYRDKIVK
jgi:hypothetical protein